MCRDCRTLLREFWSSVLRSDHLAFGNAPEIKASRQAFPSVLLLGFSLLVTGCEESQAPVKQQVDQPVPRLSIEDENLIFGNATHVDIYEQLSVDSSNLLETSEVPLPEDPSPSDADLFFGDPEPVINDETPLFSGQAPSPGAPAIGESDSIFDGESPLTEQEPQSTPTSDSAGLGSLDTKP